MRPWAEFITNESLDADAQKTLDHIFAQDKRTLQMERSLTLFGFFEVAFSAPWRDSSGSFVLCMDARSRRTVYVHPPVGWPSLVLAPRLANAIAVELIVAFFQSMSGMRTFFDPDEYQATFVPLVKSAYGLCKRDTSHKRAAARKAMVLREASLAVAYTCAADYEKRILTRLAVHGRRAACLLSLVFSARIGVQVLRWKSRCLERMYAPSGRGFRLAELSFEVARC